MRCGWIVLPFGSGWVATFILFGLLTLKLSEWWSKKKWERAVKEINRRKNAD